MATSLTGYKYRPAELQRIMSGQIGELDTDLELIGRDVAKVIKRNINVPYPPVGFRPHPARRTGRLHDSITPVVTFERGALVGVVIADVEHAWYATRLRGGGPNPLPDPYAIVTQDEVNAIRLSRRR